MYSRHVNGEAGQRKFPNDCSRMLETSTMVCCSKSNHVLICFREGFGRAYTDVLRTLTTMEESQKSPMLRDAPCCDVEASDRHGISVKAFRPCFDRHHAHCTPRMSSERRKKRRWESYNSSSPWNVARMGPSCTPSVDIFMQNRT